MDCTCVHCAHSAGGRTTVHTGKGTSHRGLPSHTTTDWVAWNNGGLFSHSAGGWKSEIKVCTGPLAAAGGARSWCSPARSCTRPLREAVFPPRVCLPAAPSPPVSPLQGHSHSPHLHPNPICKGSFPSTVTFPGPGSFSLSFRGMQFNPRQMCLSSQGWEQVRPAPIAAGAHPQRQQQTFQMSLPEGREWPRAKSSAPRTLRGWAPPGASHSGAEGRSIVLRHCPGQSLQPPRPRARQAWEGAPGSHGPVTVLTETPRDRDGKGLNARSFISHKESWKSPRARRDFLSKRVSLSGATESHGLGAQTSHGTLQGPAPRQQDSHVPCDFNKGPVFSGQSRRFSDSVSWAADRFPTSCIKDLSDCGTQGDRAC